MVRVRLEKLPLNLQQPVEKGIAILRQGGIVAYPTDTVYGLGACASNPQAVDRVYQVKERPRNMPFPLLLADISQLTELAEPVPPVVWSLIHRFLPGALTIILPRSKSAPENILAREKTVAIRIPAHPVPIALIEGLKTPIVGTSANLTGRPSPVTAAEVYAQLHDKVDLIIDGGRCPGGKESTVVDVTGEIPVILRQGAISKEELEEVCGTLLYRKETK